MRKHKKLAILLISSILIIAIALSIILPICLTSQLPKQNFSLFGQAKSILLKNFTAVNFGEKASLKRVINNENPLNLVNHYGDEPIDALWSSIPDNQKPFTIILLIPGQILNHNSEKALKSLESTADECESKGIYYAIQNINGETHMEARPPIAYLEERFASKHKYFLGLNSAELYNGVDWRGVAESNNSQYLIDCIKLSAKYGAYFLWTDTNRNYQNGMLIEWLENNEAFYSAFKEYSDYICLMNKESLAHPSTYAVMQGLWLAGLVGNWGVASDWWHWQCDGDKKSLFDENNADVEDEWDMILSYPENMYVQSMMLVMSRGGTCFKAEAPNFSTSSGGDSIAGFEYGISPLFNTILDGTITIPNRQQVLEDTNFVILGKENYSKANYDYTESNLYPKMGAGGIIPLLPKNLRLSERQVFLNQGISLIEHKLSDKEFLEKFGNNNADTYLTRTSESWYYINNLENKKGNKYASFKPISNTLSSVYINATEHTSAIITEKQNSLSFFISNYRTDKSSLIKQKTKTMREEMGWAKFVSLYLTLDKNGNPKGVSDSEKRLTTIKTIGTYNGGEPTFNIKQASDGSGANNRPYTVEKLWNAKTSELTLNITHNGIIQLDIATNSLDNAITSTPKASIIDTKVANNNDLSVLKELTKSKITDSHNYTYFSYLNYNNTFESCVNAINEQTYSVKEIKSLEKSIIKAKDQLINVSASVKILNLVLQDFNNGKYDIENKIMKNYDHLLRELLSYKKYVDGRANDLFYAKSYKKSSSNYNFVNKSNYIDKRLSTLSKSIN